MRFRFGGGYELDEDLYELRRDEEAVRLEPKVFDVLAYLVRHRERVVSKQELLEALWPGVAISESVLPHCVAAARRAVGDDGRRQAVIKTVHGRGYRFVAEGEEASTPRTGVSTDSPLHASSPASPVSEARSDSRAERTAPFVGREEVMAQLRDAVAEAIAGGGRLILLSGEPGIGKTRIAEAIAGYARNERMSVCYGRCLEDPGAPGFWPWQQVLGACFELEPSASILAELGPRTEDLSGLVPAAGRDDGRGPRSGATTIRGSDAADRIGGALDEQARFRLFESAALFLRRLAEAPGLEGLLVALEDLHWADEASLRLLRFLVGELGRSRLLVLGTYRQHELRRGQPLSELLVDLARESACERIALRGLAPEPASRLIAAVGGGRVEEGVAQAIHRLADGNPFFMQELARLVAEKGVERLAGEAPERRTLSLTLPQSVRDAIARRLETLSGDCNRLLRAAAVLGRVFNAAHLEQLVELRSPRLFDILDEALAAGLLEVSPEGVSRYAFEHQLFRQTLYEELGSAERMRLHQRAARILEQTGGGHAEARLEEIALHQVESAAVGDPGRASEACVKAAEAALERLAYEESSHWYRRALDVLELATGVEEERRCRLLVALGRALSISARHEEATATFAAAAAVARDLDRVDLLAEAALGGPTAADWDPAGRELVEETLGLLENSQTGLRARLLARRAGSFTESAPTVRRDAASREALTLARASGEPAALRDALYARLRACLGPDGVAERLSLAEEILELAETTADCRLALFGHDGALGAYLLRGDAGAAERCLAAYRRTARELRQPLFLHEATIMEGSLAMARGSFERAERLVAEALEQGRRSVRRADFMHAGQRLSLALLRGEALDGGLAGLMFGEMMEMPYPWQTAARSALALSLALRGDLDEARRHFDALGERGFAPLPRDEHWLMTMGNLGHLAVLLQDRERARELDRLLEPYAELFLVHDLLRLVSNRVASVLGSLATLLGRYDLALERFELAMAGEEAMGLEPALADSRAACAGLLRLRGAAGDAERGAALRARAEEAWRELGMGPPRAATALDRLPRR